MVDKLGEEIAFDINQIETSIKDQTKEISLLKTQVSQANLNGSLPKSYSKPESISFGSHRGEQHKAS